MNLRIKEKNDESVICTGDGSADDKKEYTKKENTVPVLLQEKRDENNAKKENYFENINKKNPGTNANKKLPSRKTIATTKTSLCLSTVLFEDKKPEFYATVLSQWALVANAGTAQQEEPWQHLQPVKTYIETTVQHAKQPHAQISIPSVTLKR